MSRSRQTPLARVLDALLGLIAGFFDATEAADSGSSSTSTLLARKHSNPPKVVGSVDASEFPRSALATIGFGVALGWSEINLTWTLAIVIGGVFAAPLAAWAVPYCRPRRSASQSAS